MFISYLVSGITAADLSIEVPDGTVFPQNQVFDIWINEEKISCMSFASANVINVQRGHDGTPAAAHDAETLIALDKEHKQNVRTSKSLDGHIALGLADGVHGESVGITDGDVLLVDGSPADNEYARFTANGIEGVAKADLITDLAVLKTADIDDTPVDGETAQPISSNWAYDHNAATTGIHGSGENTLLYSDTLIVEDHNLTLSSSVHDNTSLCKQGLLAVQTGIPSSKYARVELTGAGTYGFDIGSNFKTGKLYNACVADAGSGTAGTVVTIVDASATFTTIDGLSKGSVLKYALVTWTDSDGVSNPGTGYVTAVTNATTLAVYKTSGADLAAGDKYTITRSWYLVPTAGVYAIESTLAWSSTNMVDAKILAHVIYVNGTICCLWCYDVSNTTSFYNYKTLAGMVLLAANDILTLNVYTSIASDAAQLYGTAAGTDTCMSIRLVRAT